MKISLLGKTFGLLLTVHASAFAGVIQTFGPGSAVTSPQHTATFDSLTVYGIDLSNYTENGLIVSAPDVSYPLSVTGGSDHGFYANGGVPEGVPYTIKLVSGADMFAAEFLIDDGYPFETPRTFVWEAVNNAVVIGGGSFSYTPPRFSVPITVGILSDSGFDELRIRASFMTFGNALAIDNLRVQTEPANVPEPASLTLFGLGALGVAVGRRKLRTVKVNFTI